MLIARFDGDVERLKQAYDDAHRLIMDRGGPRASHHFDTADVTILRLHAIEPPLKP